jgi:pilus assembly protein Flp/PilA
MRSASEGEGKRIVVEHINLWATAAVVKFQEFKSRCRTFAVRQEGQGLVEYGLILGLVSVVAIAALTDIGNSVTSVLEDVATQI